MKRFFLAFMLSAFISVAGASEVVKLMTYNIRNGLGMDNVTDLRRIARTINDSAPDIVAIQEVDSVTARSNGRYVLGEIEAACGMNAIFAPAIDLGGGKYGIGILARETPLSVRRIALPGTEEPRALLIAEFNDFVFACTHLSLTEEDRLASVDIIRREAQTYDKPFFVAGDFNDEPGSTAIKELTADFTPVSDISAPTYPAGAPNIVIDYILLYNPGNKMSPAAQATVIDQPVASDHRPILVSLSF